MNQRPNSHEGKNTDLKLRTRNYALRIVKLFGALPKSVEAQTLGRQLLKSGTSPGAQYREAIRAKSGRDFISKMEGALQELEETTYWLELLSHSNIVKPDRLGDLESETDELIAIFTSMVKKVKAKG